MPEQQNQQPQEIQVRDDFSGSEYANLLKVDTNKEEILLTFANIAHGKGRVVAKVSTTPGHLKRITRLLQDIMDRYEKQFGAVEESQGPDDNKGIGFSG